MEMLADLLKLLANQRHEFLNCLQIIQGYWQLQQPEKARAYSENFSQKMRNFSNLHNLNEPALLAVLLIGMQEKLDLELGIQPLQPVLHLGEEVLQALADFWHTLTNCDLTFKAHIEEPFVVFTWILRKGQIENPEALAKLAESLWLGGGDLQMQNQKIQIFWPLQPEGD